MYFKMYKKYYTFSTNNYNIFQTNVENCIDLKLLNYKNTLKNFFYNRSKKNIKYIHIMHQQHYHVVNFLLSFRKSFFFPRYILKTLIGYQNYLL